MWQLPRFVKHDVHAAGMPDLGGTWATGPTGWVIYPPG
jgi:hypothetical protein